MVRNERATPRRYVIDWVDSASTDGWRADSDISNQAAVCQTVGFLVREDGKAITIALNYSRSEGTVPWGHMITIPKVAVIRKRRLK